jgi:hypothetical protein
MPNKKVSKSDALINKAKRTKRRMNFNLFKARMFTDESLLTYGTNEKGEKVCYGVSIEKLCQAIDEGRF